MNHQRCAMLLCMSLVCAPNSVLAQTEIEVSDPSLQSTVATRSVERGGIIVIPVFVDGQGPFRFMLDTGANRTVIGDELVSKLGLAYADESHSVELSAVTGRAIVRTVFVKALNAGAWKIENAYLPVLRAPFAALDGILGTEQFEGKRLTVDFERNAVGIDVSNNRPAQKGYVTIPAELSYGQLLIVNAKVGGVKVKGVIDTGAERSLGNLSLRRALERQKTIEQAPDRAKVQGVTTEVQFGDLLRSPVIKFSGAEIASVKLTYGDFNVFKFWGLEQQPALLIGMDVLGTVNTLIIDYRRRELQFKPRTDYLTPSPR